MDSATKPIATILVLDRGIRAEHYKEYRLKLIAQGFKPIIKRLDPEFSRFEAPWINRPETLDEDDANPEVDFFLKKVCFGQVSVYEVEEWEENDFDTSILDPNEKVREYLRIRHNVDPATVKLILGLYEDAQPMFDEVFGRYVPFELILI